VAWRYPSGETVFRAGFALGALALLVVARRQWFSQDDWAYLLWRDHLLDDGRVGAWAMTPHNGHWVAIPAALYTGTKSVFGLSSYWPYVLPTVILHLSAVWMIRAVAVRTGVTSGTATALSFVLLVFGSGGEFIAFAAITSWTLTLNAFLAQLLVLDRFEPSIRRDLAVAALGLVGTASSGFGMFFALGGAAWLTVHREPGRIPLCIGPSVVAFAAWWATWGRDQAADRVPGPRSIAPEFAVRGIVAAVDGLVAVGALTGVVIIAAAIAFPRSRPAVATGTALAVAAGSMYLGIGVQRAGFGVDFAASGRYVAFGAFLLMPLIGLGADLLRRFDQRGAMVVYGLAAVSVVVNAGRMQIVTTDRGEEAAAVRAALIEIARSPDLDQADPTARPIGAAPDIQYRDIDELVELGAIDP
jgi:hypothetical protein